MYERTMPCNLEPVASTSSTDLTAFSWWILGLKEEYVLDPTQTRSAGEGIEGH